MTKENTGKCREYMSMSMIIEVDGIKYFSLHLQQITISYPKGGGGVLRKNDISKIY